MTTLRSIFFISIFLLLVSCTRSGIDERTPLPQPTATMLPPTQVQATPHPPTISPPTETPKTQQDLSTLGTWDVVVIGDSSLWGVGDAIAAHIEDDLGISVNVHDFVISNLTAKQALEAVSTSKPDTPNARMQGWPEIIADAEFIILHPSPAESISAQNPGDWSCMYPPYYVENCALETFEQYQADLRAIIREIITLRQDKPTIIRFGSYWGRPGNWLETDGDAVCMECLETDAKAVEAVAGEFGFPFATALDVLNGQNHDQEPDALGFIGEDGVHTSQSGAQEIADQIWDLGIAPIQP